MAERKRLQAKLEALNKELSTDQEHETTTTVKQVVKKKAKSGEDEEDCD